MPNYIIQKRGHVLPAVEEFISSISDRISDVFYQYFRVVCEPGACDDCQQKSGSLVKESDAKVGVNCPPFHPNCKCSMEEVKLYPWEAEHELWTRLARPDISAKEKVRAVREFYSIPVNIGPYLDFLPLPQAIESTIRETIHITGFSDQFLYRAIYAATSANSDAPALFFTIIENAPTPITEEAILPNEDVNVDYYRWEDYHKITAYNPKKMQDLAYTDEYGFRRIYVDELGEDAYMAAFGSFYLQDSDPRLQGEPHNGLNTYGLIYRVYLSNGKTFYVVVGDMKANRDTNTDTHQYTYNPTGDPETNVDKSNADVIEFIIDLANVPDFVGQSNGFTGTPWEGGIIISMERLPFTVLDY